MRIHLTIITGVLLATSPLMGEEANIPPSASMQTQLQAIDQQIQELEVKIDGFRHKALEAEADAQQSMKSDYSQYLGKIKESEKYEVQSREASRQLKLLMQQRQAMLQEQTPPSQKSK